jgi:hypothetical protein
MTEQVSRRGWLLAASVPAAPVSLPLGVGGCNANDRVSHNPFESTCCREQRQGRGRDRLHGPSIESIRP